MLFNFHLASVSGITNADFSNAKVLLLEDSNQVVLKSGQVLVEEIQKRTQLNLEIINTRFCFNESTPTIIVGTEDRISRFDDSFKLQLKLLSTTQKDGFKILSIKDKNILIIAGNDARGCLYGVGKFLRSVNLNTNLLQVDQEFNISSSPESLIRGQGVHIHRGGINKPWGLIEFDRYVRDLVLFGTNVIELATDITPEQVNICKSYGLEVWIFSPNGSGDYTSTAGVAAQLSKREAYISSLPPVDVIFVPGGDPGNLEPNVFFDFLSQYAELLKRIRPKTKLWVSPQSFDATNEWMDTFLSRANGIKSWLGGVVYAPWIKYTISEVRAQLDPSIPICHLPDMCHITNAQYPVLNLDLAYAMTLGRIAINPLPKMQKHIHNLFKGYTRGSFTYSEANYDDLNKFIWCDQEWNSNITVEETIADYGKLFLRIDNPVDFVQGVLGLEKNLEGPLVSNASIAITLDLWKKIETEVSSSTYQNPRFQMLLLRSYYDLYQQERLKFETNLELQARSKLAQAGTLGSASAINEAKILLNSKNTNATVNACKTKCQSLFALLTDSTLSNNYQWLMEIQVSGYMKNIDFPVNNKDWLLNQFTLITAMATEAEKLTAIQNILNRNQTGTQEYYEDMGSPESLTRVAGIDDWSTDPGTLRAPRVYFGSGSAKIPIAQRRQLTTLYNFPLTMQYNNLDKNAGYKLRVIYEGLFSSNVKLEVDGALMHNYFIPNKGVQYEFIIPAELTSDGIVNITWQALEGQTATQVAELWLIKR